MLNTFRKHEAVFSSSGIRKIAVLSGLFFAVAAIPLLGTYWILQRLTKSARAVSAAPAVAILPAADFSSRPGFVKIDPAEDLNPIAGKDFVLGIWVRPPRNLPATPQVVPILSRYSPDKLNKPGYVVSLSRDAETIRATVDWRSSDGAGGTYVFPQISVIPQSWILIVLSYHDGRYLALHSVTRLPSAESSVRLIGGYDLEREVRPDSSAELVIGSVRGVGYRGAFGPVFLLQSKDLTEELGLTLKNLGREPGRFPKNLRENTVRLWSENLITDQASAAHKISRGASPKNGQEGE